MTVVAEGVTPLLEVVEVEGLQKLVEVVEEEQNFVGAVVAAVVVADNTAGNMRHNFDSLPMLRRDLGLPHIESTCGCSPQESGRSPA